MAVSQAPTRRHSAPVASHPHRGLSQHLHHRHLPGGRGQCELVALYPRRTLRSLVEELKEPPGPDHVCPQGLNPPP